MKAVQRKIEPSTTKESNARRSSLRETAFDPRMRTQNITKDRKAQYLKKEQEGIHINPEPRVSSDVVFILKKTAFWNGRIGGRIFKAASEQF